MKTKILLITPDVARETGSGASVAGSQEFRLKYAFAQFNIDDWTTHGSWVRLGVHQTPFIDYTEGIYPIDSRKRFSPNASDC